MTDTTIMIVEDEQKMARLLSDYLEGAGFKAICVHNGLGAVQQFKQVKPALILLDLMLPGCDGLAICREIRSFSEVPIVMITAKVEEIDRLLGLELGADDYICKPFSPREVVARVKAILRRTATGTTQKTGLHLDPERLYASLDGKPLILTAVEFRLLHMLAENPGRIYGRQELMDKIYIDERIVSDRTVDSHVKKLRRKLGLVSPQKELIHSIYGVGYKFWISSLELEEN